MRNHQKRVSAILVVTGTASWGIAFADHNGSTDPPGFGLTGYSGNKTGAAQTFLDLRLIYPSTGTIMACYYQTSPGPDTHAWRAG